MSEHFDVAVIGSGPGGYTCAIRASQRGLKVTCIDSNPSLGGTCLNVGCIPSKTLLYASHLFDEVNKYGNEWGFKGNISCDFSTLQTKKADIVKQLSEGIGQLFRKYRVERKIATAQFRSPHELELIDLEGKKSSLSAQSIVIATGSQPNSLPLLPFDEHQIVSSTGALDLKEIPKRLLVVGGGVIGVELASVYKRLGSDVTIVELLDSLCIGFDRDLRKGLYNSLKKQGIKIHLSTSITQVEKSSKEIQLTVDTQGTSATIIADIVLVATGRKPFSAQLGFHSIGGKVTEKGYIVIDESFRTNFPNVYAIGDVIEGPMLAHRSSEEALVVADLISGNAAKINYMLIPNVVYTHPELASVGLSEDEARQLNLDMKIGIAYLRGNPRARCVDESEGVVKIIAESTSQKIIGMHIFSAGASEMISMGSLAILKKTTLNELSYFPYAHPSLSESIKEAAMDALRQGLH